MLEPVASPRGVPVLPLLPPLRTSILLTASLPERIGSVIAPNSFRVPGRVAYPSALRQCRLRLCRRFRFPVCHHSIAVTGSGASCGTATGASGMCHSCQRAGGIGGRYPVFLPAQVDQESSRVDTSSASGLPRGYSDTGKATCDRMCSAPSHSPLVSVVCSLFAACPSLRLHLPHSHRHSQHHHHHHRRNHHPSSLSLSSSPPHSVSPTRSSMVRPPRLLCLKWVLRVDAGSPLFDSE